jgi:hypothetical protein
VDRNHFYSAWGTGYNGCLSNSDSLVIVSAPGGRPGYAGKFTVRQQDHCNTLGGLAMIGHVHKIYDGDDRWYALSMYISPEFNSRSWNVFSGYKTRDDSGAGNTFSSASIMSDEYNGVWDYRFGSWQTGANGLQHIGPLIHGWTDWLIHIKWSKTNTGIIEVYQNGNRVIYRPNIRTIPYKAGTSTFVSEDAGWEWNVGLYRGDEAATSIVYMYNVKMGTTRADVEYKG